jgi:hypothetical protein
MQWVKQAPLSMLGWGQNQFQQITENALRWMQPWSKRYQASQAKAQRATEWISRRCQHAKEGIRTLFQPLTAFCREQVQPVWRQFKAVCKGKWERASDFFQQKHRKALAYLQAKQEKLKKLSYQDLVDRLFSNPLMMSLPVRLQRWLKKWLYRPFVRSIFEGVVKGYCVVSTWMLQVISEFMQGTAKIGGMVGGVIGRGMQVVGVVQRKCMHGLNFGLNWMGTWVLQGIYYVLLMATLTGILGTMGVRSMGRLMGHMMKKVRLC